MTSLPDDQTLCAWHAAHHARLTELLLQTIERLMGQDIEGARQFFDTAVDELLRGLVLEEAIILPLYETLVPHAPQGRPDVVAGDHVILRRTIEVCQTFLRQTEELPASVRLRQIVKGLPLVYRLTDTLEHHTLREERHVYPAVAAALAGDARAAVADELRHLAHGG